jgi:glycosyltransferase involved in cell wall biosynthesis
MRIGIFTDTYVPDINGVVTVVRLMERELRKLGHEVIVFAPSHPGVYGNEPDVFRFRSVRFIFYSGMRVALPYNRRAFQILRTLDIVHTQDPFSVGLVGFWAAVRYRIPHIHTYHTLYTEYRKYLPLPIRPSRRMVEHISRIFCNRCDAVIAPSKSIEQELLRYGIHVPIYVLPFGVDEEAFLQPEVWNLRETLGLPHHAAILLHVGRLGWEKNVEFIIRGFQYIVALRPDTWLVLVGDGPHRPVLEKLVRELNLVNKVIFLGRISKEQLIDAYRQATLFVFASKTETQGLVVMEALAAGLPVVALNAMGVRDFILQGKTGLLVEEDEKLFADACLSLLNDPERRKTMGQTARQWAIARSAKASALQLVRIYEAVRERRMKLSPPSTKV